MPNQFRLPAKPQVDAQVRAQPGAPIRARAPARSVAWTIDSIGVWALVLGFAAGALALLIYRVDGNTVASSFVLATTTAIIGIVLHQSAQSDG